MPGCTARGIRAGFAAAEELAALDRRVNSNGTPGWARRKLSALAAPVLLLALAVFAGLSVLAGAPAMAAPDWVKHNGVSSEYGSDRYLTGYGVASGDDAVAEAKQQAAADLARKISGRIESEVSDVVFRLTMSKPGCDTVTIAVSGVKP